MGGFAFGAGYFGQYSQGGSVPPDTPVTADVVVLAQSDVHTVVALPDVDEVDAV
jgi:hypothetical protein